MYEDAAVIIYLIYFILSTTWFILKVDTKKQYLKAFRGEK